MDEFALIRHLNRIALEADKDAQVIVGIGDDAAIVRPLPKTDTVLACDAMVDGIHFAPDTMLPFHVGHKALVSNISDMAAMGANPRFALVTLVVPQQMDVPRLQGIYEGLYSCAKEYGVAIIGGDTVSTTGPLTISVTITGEVEQGRTLLRSNAKPGDVVFLTGPVGLSAAGLHYLLSQGSITRAMADARDHIKVIIRGHQLPSAQVAAGRLLAQSDMRISLNDVSDGLASEAFELAEASGARIVLEAAKIPVHPSLLQYAQSSERSVWDWILYGGEDYQLLGTVGASDWPELQSSFSDHRLALHPIGRVEASPTPAVEWITPEAHRAVLEKKGYNHFGRGSEGGEQHD